VTHIYLGAVAFGVTLLVASLLLGGKDAHVHGHTVDSGFGLGWAPVTSLRFWVFLLAFGGAAGLALDALGSSELVAAIGAGLIGWAAGAIAVAIIRNLTRQSVSSEVSTLDLIGETGTLLLPVAPGRPGKVRVSLKGRAEDYVANVVNDGGELPTGTPVQIVAEGERGSLLVAKGEL
jgi:membrane protein implicated in regulation of membrane protease activity